MNHSNVLSESYLEKKIKIGFVQINNSFSNQNYLPYSVGFLQSYAKTHLKKIDRFEFLLPLYKRIPIERAVNHLQDANAIFFSTYVWNFNISCSIANLIKKNKPETLIIFGGCHVPDKSPKKFMSENPFIDIASTGEGEIPFTAILENICSGEWNKVPSITFREKDKLITTLPVPRIEDLNDIPSPYLSGFFNPLMKANPNEKWIGLWETNRGCPFSCTFCDWGTGSKKRMANYEMERLYKEIDWFSQNKIEFVYCCDANFGLFKERDRKIVEYMAKNKKEWGYPVQFSVQNTKNSTAESYYIQSVLTKADLTRGVLLAFQSLHEPTLKAVKRSNIHLSTFHELQKQFNNDKIPTFSDIILGLPEETYESFTDGVSRLIENGQHNRIQFNNLSILPNAEMNEPQYLEKYGLDIVQTKIINMHGSLAEWTDEIYETQQLIVGSKTMPRIDWRRARKFGYMTSLLHFDKLLQIPFVLANRDYKISFKEMIHSFMSVDPKECPTLSEINSFFDNHALEIQNGGTEYCESKRWLNIFWYPDELAMINLITENKDRQFYQEAEMTLNNLITKKGFSDLEPIRESIALNSNLLKVPNRKEYETIELEYNIWEAYRAGLTGENLPIKKEKSKYIIDRSKEAWTSLEDWCEKVIWWGNKKGAYMYECIPVLDKKQEAKNPKLKPSESF